MHTANPATNDPVQIKLQRATELVAEAERRQAALLTQIRELGGKVGALEEQRDELESRVARYSSLTENVIAAEPEAIVSALSAWLKRDAVAVAGALREVLRSAIA